MHFSLEKRCFCDWKKCSFAVTTTSRISLDLDIEAFKDVCYGEQRRKIYIFLENPKASFGSKLFTFTSMTFVIVSVAGEVLASVCWS